MAFDCTIDGGFGNEVDCVKGKGVSRVFFAQASLIDWDAMYLSPLHWDSENEQIKDYIYLVGGVHHEIKFEKLGSVFFSERTSDNDYYETLLTLILKGNSPARAKKIRRLLNCCDLALHVYLSNGTQRVLGRDLDVTGFVNPVSKSELGRHRNDAGTLGGDDSRDELDFTQQTEYEPVYGNVAISTLVGLSVQAKNKAAKVEALSDGKK